MWISLSVIRSACAILAIEPTVKGLLVDAETTLTEPDHFEIFCALAKIVRFTNAYAKDFRYLFSGIGALTGVAANILLHFDYSFCSLTTIQVCKVPPFCPISR